MILESSCIFSRVVFPQKEGFPCILSYHYYHTVACFSIDFVVFSNQVGGNQELEGTRKVIREPTPTSRSLTMTRHRVITGDKRKSPRLKFRRVRRAITSRRVALRGGTFRSSLRSASTRLGNDSRPLAIRCRFRDL